MSDTTKSLPPVRVLNLYAGIGGNRKLWDNAEVTAVEIDPAIAAIYQDLYPNDTVVVGDAHQYLAEHYAEFDFIWTSPPCPTHSRMNFMKHMPKRYPDMKLYEEILFLQHWFKGKYVVENVRSYYEPLVKPQELQSHYFWANFYIPDTGKARKKVRNDAGHTLEFKLKQQNMVITDWHGYKKDKRTLVNNMVEPELGLHILNAAQGTLTSAEGNDLVALDLFSELSVHKSAKTAPTRKQGVKDNE